MGEKGPEWNQVQWKIAYELEVNKKSVNQVCEESKIPLMSVYKIKEKLAKGFAPPSYNPDDIAKAPLPKLFGAAAKKNPKFAVPDVDNSSTSLPTELTLKEPKGIKPNTKAALKATAINYTKDAVHTSLLRFVPQIQQLPMTPNIYVSYMVAVKKGYNGELVDWLSFCAEDVWHGRSVNMFQEMSEFNVREEVQPDGVGG